MIFLSGGIVLGNIKIAKADCANVNQNPDSCNFAGSDYVLYFGNDYDSGYVDGDQAECSGGTNIGGDDVRICFYRTRGGAINSTENNVAPATGACRSTDNRAVRAGDIVNCLLLYFPDGTPGANPCPGTPDCAGLPNCCLLPSETVGVAPACIPNGCGGGCPAGCGGADDPDCGGTCLDCSCAGDTDCATSCAGGDGCCAACAADPDCGGSPCPGSLSCTATIAAADVGCSCGAAIATAANVGDHCCSINNTFYGTLAACNASPCGGGGGATCAAGDGCLAGCTPSDPDCGAAPPPGPSSSSGLIPCGRAVDDPNTLGRDETAPCTLCHVVLLGQLIIEFFVKISAIFAVLAIIGGGLVYVVAAGNTNTIGKAKSIIQYALLGFLVVFIAWAVVNSILVTMGYIDPIGGEWYMMNC